MNSFLLSLDWGLRSRMWARIASMMDRQQSRGEEGAGLGGEIVSWVSPHFDWDAWGILGLKTGLLHFECGGAGEGSGWFSFWLELGTFGQNTEGRFWEEVSKVMWVRGAWGTSGNQTIAWILEIWQMASRTYTQSVSLSLSLSHTHTFLHMLWRLLPWIPLDCPCC